MPELVALAKAKPGTLNFGSTGTGGVSHLAGEMLNTAAGIKMTHVAYKGTGPALNDLLGGQIQVMFNDTALPHVKADKLRALAVTGKQRWRDAPEIPTMTEVGVAGFETYNWFGLFVPAGTPAAIIGQLNRELVPALKDPAMQSWMQSRGSEAVSSSPEEFAAYIRKDVEKWAKVVKAVGLVARMIKLYPVTDNFACEVGDVDLSKPLTAEDDAAIKAAFWKYAVLVFPQQALSLDQHVAFSERFGPMEPSTHTYADEIKKGRIDNRVSDVSNLGEDNEILPAESRKRASGLANRLWHTDSIFKHVPALTSLLYAHQIAPIGGYTEFADMRAAWDALPAARQKKLEGLKVFHSIFHSRAKIGMTDFTERERASLPGAEQVLVRTIPQTGRKALYLASHAVNILGFSKEESNKLLNELMEFATQRQFVYAHRWRVHDLVMWDNRCTMHRGTDYDERRWKRDMHRATVSDIGNTLEVTG